MEVFVHTNRAQRGQPTPGYSALDGDLNSTTPKASHEDLDLHQEKKSKKNSNLISATYSINGKRARSDSTATYESEENLHPVKARKTESTNSGISKTFKIKFKNTKTSLESTTTNNNVTIHSNIKICSDKSDESGFPNIPITKNESASLPTPPISPNIDCQDEEHLTYEFPHRPDSNIFIDRYFELAARYKTAMTEHGDLQAKIVVLKVLCRRLGYRGRKLVERHLHELSPGDSESQPENESSKKTNPNNEMANEAEEVMEGGGIGGKGKKGKRQRKSTLDNDELMRVRKIWRREEASTGRVTFRNAIPRPGIRLERAVEKMENLVDESLEDKADYMSKIFKGLEALRELEKMESELDSKGDEEAESCGVYQLGNEVVASAVPAWIAWLE